MRCFKCLYVPQVSVGGTGVCAITSSKGSDTSEDATEGGLPDKLVCWGAAKHKVNSTAFDSWDQVSVGAIFVCAVSMDSDLVCFGAAGIMPPEIHDYHKYIIVA